MLYSGTALQLYSFSAQQRLHHRLIRINGREQIALACLATVCLVIGVYPQLAINVIGNDARQIVKVSDIAQSSRIAHHPIEQNP